MLNKGFRIIWVKVHVNKAKHIHLTIPISLSAFNELLECLMDLLEVICFFTPKRLTASSTTVSIHAVKELSQALIHLFDSLAGTEPYDLVDVEVENVKVSVKIR